MYKNQESVTIFFQCFFDSKDAINIHIFKGEYSITFV